ncbi:ATP-binding protein [Shimia aestuarii]|uniref:histidine kinase n=1 Tax=Shimia aestuarii TaxID=254406 RepID=A0A1I4I5D7_9RHOB|nr:ATP-binding protein [Shimia aestuarii]SFL49529.1 PAS domain S-box-containing protein [Shimia aestuarii]
MARRGITIFRRGWRLGSFLALLAGILLVLAVFVSIEVRTNLNRLNSASSDNIQWTLSQIEVEMLELTGALIEARYQDTPDLERIRLEFDILYSRVQSLHGSPVYGQITEYPPFRASLDATQSFLDETVPLMDGPDAALRSALPTLGTTAKNLRNDVRKLAVVGIGGFAQKSDERRADVANTLIRLAALAVMLLGALVALIFYMLSILRKARARGAALSRANKRTNTILTTSLDGVIVADPSGWVIEFNPAAQDIFGMTQEQARRHRISDLFLTDALLPSRLIRQDKASEAPKNPIIGQGRIQLDAVRANGEVFPAEISVQSAFDGRHDLYIAFLHDISKRVADEQELVDARDRALAGEQAKADFLAVMSHEIRTPLNGLLGNLSLLGDTPLTPDQAQFTRNMEISGKILLRHVDSVLDIARFEADRSDPKTVPTNLTELVQNVVDSQLGLAERQGAALDWHWEGNALQWAEVAPAALEQVLLNLVGNAIKFTPKGRIIIELEATKPVASPQHLLEVRVIDTGIGIPESDLELVFQDFVTRDTSFGRLAGGTGLGLGIARRIVESMGGEIGVESTEDVGSVFWFRVPVTASASPDANEQSTGKLRAMRALDVLLVEDNQINRDVTCEMLRRAGHKVVCSPDGASGVENARAKRFDLILMDISMPVMDGFQATEQIRNTPGASRDTPIIAFSANVLPSDREKIAQAGMNGLLSKPLILDHLKSAIAGVFDSAMATAPSDVTGALIDLPHLTATREELGDEVFASLLTRFVAELNETVDALTSGAPDHPPLPEIAASSHKAAGSAVFFGATRLHGALARIETAAKAGQSETITQELRALPGLWTATGTALHSHLPDM